MRTRWLETTLLHAFTIVIVLIATLTRAETATTTNSAPQLVDGVAAQVNAHVITVGDVLMTLAPVRQRIATEAVSKKDFAEKMQLQYDAVLDDLINRKLIVDAFADDEGQIPDWAVERRQEEIIREQFGDDFARLQDALQNDGMTMKQWQEIVRERMIIESMRSAKVNSTVRINAGDIRRRYEQHLDDYRTPTRVKLSVIMVSKGEGDNQETRRELIRSVHQRILAGQDFETLALEVSQGVAAEKGGDWGWVNPHELRPELEKAAMSLPPRGISEVIESGDDLYILQVTARQPGGVTPFEDVAPQIQRSLRAEQAEAHYTEWIHSLQENAYIKRFDVQAF